MKYQLSTAAGDDIDAAALYIAGNSPQAGAKFYDAVERTIDDICEHPRRGARFESSRPELAALRKIAVRGFPNHLIFYRIDGQIILIVRVIHGARDLPAIFHEDD